MERWPQQVRAFDGTIDAINRGVKRLCVTSPTGSGKTRMMLDVIDWARERGKSVALYAMRRMLYDQICRVLEGEGIYYGKRASGHEGAALRDIQVCMMQTEVSRRRGDDYKLHDADVVIVDEWHQCGGEKFQEVIDTHVANSGSVVAYTATPLDLPNTDELLVAGCPSECRRIGALVPAMTFAPDEPDLRHIRKYRVGQDLTEKDNSKAIMRPGVFSRVVAAWQSHNPEQRPTLLFGPDVRGSLFFAQEFHKAGIRSAHIDGEDCWIDGEFHASESEIREHIAELSRTGQIKVVCNRFVLREGIDWPWIECGIFATVFGALTSFIQSGGRLLRASPTTGKTQALILDHGGNWHRHGSLNEDREWTLGQTNYRTVGERAEQLREKKEAEPIVCPQCGKVRVAGRTCMACGFVAHKKSRMVVQIDGTLRPVEGDVYKPRRIKREANTSQLWERIYYRARSKK